MGKHTLPGRRQPLPVRPVTRRRKAEPAGVASRRLAAPAALTAVLLASGGTAGTAFAGEDDGSGGSGSSGSGTEETAGTCADGSPAADGCDDGASGSPVSGRDLAGMATSRLGGGSGGSTADGSGEGGVDAEGSGASADGAASTSADRTDARKPGATEPGATKPGATSGLAGLTAAAGKAPDLSSATSGLTQLPDPSAAVSGAGSSVPGASGAGSVVNTLGGASGTAIGTDQGTDLGGLGPASPPGTSGGLPGLPATPATDLLAGSEADRPEGGLPDVPGVTNAGPLAGPWNDTDLPDVSGVTGTDGLAPDLSPVARTAGLPDYSGLGGLPDVAGLAGGTSTGPTQVDLNGQGGQDVDGTATIDNDRVRGQATGLDPDERYVSFFYGATSSATNNNPCILDGTNPVPGGQTVGEWQVDENGNGTLDAPNPDGNMYKATAGTMSIRKVEHGFDEATAPPVNPLSYSLSSCGEVNRVSTLDPATNAVPKLPTQDVPPVPYVSGPGVEG